MDRHQYRFTRIFIHTGEAVPKKYQEASRFLIRVTPAESSRRLASAVGSRPPVWVRQGRPVMLSFPPGFPNAHPRPLPLHSVVRSPPPGRRGLRLGVRHGRGADEAVAERRDPPGHAAAGELLEAEARQPHRVEGHQATKEAQEVGASVVAVVGQSCSCPPKCRSRVQRPFGAMHLQGCLPLAFS